MLIHTPKVYQGRLSDTREYWHERVKYITHDQLIVNDQGKKPCLLGFCSHTGIARNLGRIGAFEGPDTIRKMLGPLPYHLTFEEITDLGNIIEQGDLEASHYSLYELISQLLTHNYFPIILGGGHDLAYPHGKAVLDYCLTKKEKVGVINLDAHLDLRPLSSGKRHSGSPFFQLSEEFKSDFHYLCMGLQEASNPASLIVYAEKIQANLITMEDFHLSNWVKIQETLERFCSDKNKIYLTIDLDGFNSAYAPGVSAPSPFGFEPTIILKVINWIVKSKKLISLDIVELNPSFDQDNSTARLAARLIEYSLRIISQKD